MANWAKISALVIGAASVAVVLFVWRGARAQQRALSELLEPLLNAPRTGTLQVDLTRLKDIPAPVAKYFHRVLSQGQPVIRLARIQQSGTLRADTHSERRMPFEATHTVSPLAPGFVWNARVSVFPLLHIRIQDAYKAGKGSGKVILASAFPISFASGNPEMNSGALHRYLAESVWYPTALLPSDRLRWTAIDGNKALATLTDRDITVSLEFWFNADGEVDGIYSPARWGTFDGGYKQKPWEGHFKNYVLKSGMRVPSEGEVGWYDDGTWRSVWKGQIVEAHYELTQ